MKNISFFIIIISQYLFSALMLDIVSGDGLLQGAIFFIISLILIFIISLIYYKKSKLKEISMWALLKKITPTIISIELIIMFFLRLYVLMNI